jgi:hypothetical protein
MDKVGMIHVSGNQKRYMYIYIYIYIFRGDVMFIVNLQTFSHDAHWWKANSWDIVYVKSESICNLLTVYMMTNINSHFSFWKC